MAGECQKLNLKNSAMLSDPHRLFRCGSACHFFPCSTYYFILFAGNLALAFIGNLARFANFELQTFH